MPRKSNPAPEYKRHPNGSAYVYHRSIDRPGHVLYLGPHGSEKSLRKYRAFLKRLEAQAATVPAVAGEPLPVFSGAVIVELVASYLQHCEGYYRHADGTKTKEFSCMKEALTPLLELFGDETAATFSIQDFETYRNHLIGLDYARTTINGHAGRVRRMFRWAAQKGYVSPTLWHGLTAVEGLKRGRTQARETPDVLAVSWDTVALTLPHLSPVVAAMVETQFWCGMRPQDVCGVRRCDLDMSSDVWLYRPAHHKNAWRGQTLLKAIPQRVQHILRSWFKPDADAYLFSPRDAVLWHAEQKASEASRTTHQQRELSRRFRPPRHRDHYTTDTYRQAVEYGLERLNAERAKDQLPPIKWTPNQLRHGIATYLERTQGRQSAQRYLGHKHLSTTEIYVEKDGEELIAIARVLDARLRAVGQAAIDGAL